MKGKRPDYTVSTVVSSDSGDRWREIDVGFTSDKGGTMMVNHYYFYGVDRDFGPFFLKFCTYFPYTAKLYLNGHEWAKRQAARWIDADRVMPL